MSETTRIGINKFEGSDTVKRSDFNNNWDIIDEAIGAKHNFDAESDPDENNDETEGYRPGSLWVNKIDKKAFVCTDATEISAVWEIYTGLEDLQNDFNSHESDEAPHEYGGRFKWQYNETDDSLELVVVE